MSDELDIDLDEILREDRQGCWCAPYRKPCEYHAGFQDGMDVLHDRMEKFVIGVTTTRNDGSEP